MYMYMYLYIHVNALLILPESILVQGQVGEILSKCHGVYELLYSTSVHCIIHFTLSMCLLALTHGGELHVHGYVYIVCTCIYNHVAEMNVHIVHYVHVHVHVYAPWTYMYVLCFYCTETVNSQCVYLSCRCQPHSPHNTTMCVYCEGVLVDK